MNPRRPLSILAIVPFVWVFGCSSSADQEAVESESDLTSCTAKQADAGACAKAPAKRQSLDTFACPKGKKEIKVAFYDADSTLRVSKRNGVTAMAIDDVDILPFAARSVKADHKAGYLVAIVSNQGGVGSGKTKYEVAEGGLRTTAEKLGQLGAKVDYFDFAENDDEFRKPEVGMATRLGEFLEAKCGRGIDVAASKMIGDSAYKEGEDGPSPDGRKADDFSNADRLFAENLGVPFQEPTDAYGWRDFGVFNVLGEKQLVPFLKTIEERAASLRKEGKDEEAASLDEEVASNRNVNDLQ